MDLFTISMDLFTITDSFAGTTVSFFCTKNSRRGMNLLYPSFSVPSSSLADEMRESRADLNIG